MPPCVLLLQCFYGNATKQSDGSFKCKCETGWHGKHCSESGVIQCHHGSYDAANDYCKCDPLWTGEACDVFTCIHGTVVQTGLDAAGAPTLSCQCSEGWTGPE